MAQCCEDPRVMLVLNVCHVFFNDYLCHLHLCSTSGLAEECSFLEMLQGTDLLRARHWVQLSGHAMQLPFVAVFEQLVSLIVCLFLLQLDCISV